MDISKIWNSNEFGFLIWEFRAFDEKGMRLHTWARSSVAFHMEYDVYRARVDDENDPIVRVRISSRQSDLRWTMRPGVTLDGLE